MGIPIEKYGTSPANCISLSWVIARMHRVKSSQPCCVKQRRKNVVNRVSLLLHSEICFLPSRIIHLSYRWIRCEVMRLLLKTIIETWLREKCRRWDEILTSEGLVSAVLRIVPLTRWPECAGWLEWLVVDWELSGSPDEILWWWRKPPASWTCCCWLWWATAATAMCLSSIVEPMALLLPPRDPDPLTPPTLPPLLMPPMPPPTPLVLLLFLCFLYFTLRMKRTGMG